MKSIWEESLSVQAEVIKHRRYLHEHAEVGFDLPKTTEYIYNQLKKYGFLAKKMKKGGVIAEIPAKDGGRDEIILLRADVDGLKIQEESGLEFACPNGRMHACGHDMHAAALLGAAKLLKNKRLPCSVRLLFQPAEELLQGGKYALSQGVAERVKCAFSLHVLSGVEAPVGTILLPVAGVTAPSADNFTLSFTGKSCHGATPQEGVDAIAAANAVWQGLQTLVAREIATGDGVVTVGGFQAGESPNVISEKAVLQGTCRTFDDATRAYLKKRIREMTKWVSQAYRVRGETRYSGGCPCLRQDEKLLESAKRSWTESWGKEKVSATFSTQKRVGASEDFAYIAEAVPSLLISVVASQKGGGYPLHHPRLVFDERALSTCVACYLSFAIQVGVEFKKGN
ncbi:MAG: amidohydrolase [Clostridia bacterium]|nr:amidohydrolase [Clostridia bacterium]